MSHENQSQDFPETAALLAVQRADAKTIERLTVSYPASAKHNSGDIVTPDHYWDVAIAASCADLGLKIGFSTDNKNDIQEHASEATLDYISYLSGFELRGEGNVAADKSRSGIFTLLNAPFKGQLFEHIYALVNDIPIENVMMSDHSLERSRKHHTATVYEIIDHEGVERLYREDPKHCVQLYLARRLPSMKYSRTHITAAENLIDWKEAEIAAAPGTIVEDGVIISAEERAEELRYQRSRLRYSQQDYNFTLGLLAKGYEPYSLKDIIGIAHAYVTSLLATRSELNPANLKVDIPDRKQRISEQLTGLLRLGNADQN
jgi:hypothetical protein